MSDPTPTRRSDRLTMRRIAAVLNEPRPVDPGTVRLGCLLFVVAFAGISVMRWVALDEIRFPVLRGMVIAYGLLGIALAPRLEWYRVRAYVAGVALLVPLTTSYMVAAKCDQVAELGFLAIVTFLCLSFLLTGRDIVLVDLGLVAGNAIVFHLVPPALSPYAVWTVLFGSIMAGSLAGVVFVLTRGFMHQSAQAWQVTYARERVLREFSESASEALTRGTLHQVLASLFLKAAGGSTAALYLRCPETEGARTTLGALVGAGATPVATAGVPIPPAVEALWERTHRDGHLLLHDDLSDAERGVLGGFPSPAGVVVLPIPGFVPGLLVLLADVPFTPSSEEIHTWQAMATQSGVALANAYAWETLRAQEARARALADERSQVAELKARIVTQASHEFRTPLSVIFVSTEALLHYGPQLSEAQRIARLRKIQDAVNQLTELIEDMLAFGRAQARNACVVQPVDLGRLCQDIVSDVQQTATAAHELVLSAAGLEAEALADPKLLRQIVGNLLGNAVKYSPAGGRVMLDVARHDGAVEIRVSDSGIGITPEDQAQLFEPFHRGGNVGKIDGSGLGLAITRQAVEAHGGSITVESRLGEGTTFVVRLPAPVVVG